LVIAGTSFRLIFEQMQYGMSSLMFNTIIEVMSSSKKARARAADHALCAQDGALSSTALAKS
jgi:hypothetical protein